MLINQIASAHGYTITYRRAAGVFELYVGGDSYIGWADSLRSAEKMANEWIRERVAEDRR